MGSFRFSLLLTLFLVATFLFHVAPAAEGLTERKAAVADPKSALIGPGSSLPVCRSKCGRCRPCKPVRVHIQPGLILSTEYYPEAWRCRCGNNRLFKP